MLCLQMMTVVTVKIKITRELLCLQMMTVVTVKIKITRDCNQNEFLLPRHSVNNVIRLNLKQHDEWCGEGLRQTFDNRCELRRNCDQLSGHQLIQKAFGPHT